jgi:hypothetical protein
MCWLHLLERIRPSIREGGVEGAADGDEGVVSVVVARGGWRWTEVPFLEMNTLALQ